jgi:hypothetical protein
MAASDAKLVAQPKTYETFCISQERSILSLQGDILTPRDGFLDTHLGKDATDDLRIVPCGRTAGGSGRRL